MLDRFRQQPADFTWDELVRLLRGFGYQVDHGKNWFGHSAMPSTTISHTARQKGTAPEQPLKGSFNVRTGPDLHRRAVIAASRAGMSLNAFVTRALEAAVAEEIAKRPSG